MALCILAVTVNSRLSKEDNAGYSKDNRIHIMLLVSHLYIDVKQAYGSVLRP